MPVELVFALAGLVLLGFCAFAALVVFFRRRHGEPLAVAGYVIAGPTGTRPPTAPKTMGNPMQEEDEDLKNDLKKPQGPPAPQSVAAHAGQQQAGGLGMAPPPQVTASGAAAVAPSAIATTLGVSPPDDLRGACETDGPIEHTQV